VSLTRQVVTGIPGVPSQGPVAECARNLLDRCDGDVERALLRVGAEVHQGWSDSCIRFLAACVPGGGMALKMERLWVQLRMVALVAALYGHDVGDSAVCHKMLICLVDTKISNYSNPKLDSNVDPIAQGAKTVRQGHKRQIIGADATSASGPALR
jgi:hypothetical protein